MGLRWWHTADEKAADFAARWPAQPDDEFLADCGVAGDPAAAPVALAVRRSVARYGVVAAGHIRAGHSYPGELEALSGWDSIDFLGWVFELERELGWARVPRGAFDRLPCPFSVRDLAEAVVARLRGSPDAEQGAADVT